MLTLERRRMATSFLRDLYVRIKDDDVGGLASQLAYFFLLSLFPALVFLITLLGYLPIHTHDVLDFLKQYAPGEAMVLIRDNVHKIMEHDNKGLLSFGLLGTLWAASNGINAVMRAFNKAYDKKETRSFIVTRALSVVLTIGMIFVIIFALIIPVFGNVVGDAIFTTFHLPDFFWSIWSIVRLLLSFLILFLMFAFVYTFAPNQRLKPREVISGSLFATFGWVIVSYLFAFYVERFGNYSTTYGSLGGIIILILWFYLTAWVVLLGGEINALLNCYRISGGDTRNKTC